MLRSRLLGRLTQASVAALALMAVPALPQSTYPSPEERDFLTAHNIARVDAGAPLLVWSDRLARDAQDWADHLAARNLYGARGRARTCGAAPATDGRHGK